MAVVETDATATKRTTTEKKEGHAGHSARRVFVLKQRPQEVAVRAGADLPVAE